MANRSAAPLAAAPLTVESPPADGVFTAAASHRAARSPELMRPSTEALSAQAHERRERLTGLLDGLVFGEQPTREQAIDIVLAVIEDAHSADPLLFGPDGAGHFARLHEARSAPRPNAPT